MSELFGYGSMSLVTIEDVLLSFLLTFLLASVIAKTYQITYEGLSWSKSLTQALVLGSLVTCLIMIAIGDNLARGVGIIGSLAIIRFRTNLRDPRDIVFVFVALGVGVAAGVQSYVPALVGTAAFCLVALLLRFSNIGTSRKHDGMLRFQVPADSEASARVGEVLKRVTRTFALIAMNRVAQGEMIDYTYQVKLNEPEEAEELLRELERIDQIIGLKYMSNQSTVEV